MEKKYNCWKESYQRSMDANDDLRKLYWSEVDMDNMHGWEAEQDFVRAPGTLEVPRHG